MKKILAFLALLLPLAAVAQNQPPQPAPYVVLATTDLVQVYRPQNFGNPLNLGYQQVGNLIAAGGGLPSQTGQSGNFLTTNGTVASWAAVSGTGTVTSVSVVTANGVSGTVATNTTTPAITLVLGAIVPTSVNGLTITTSSGTLTIVNGSTLATAGANSLTLTTSGTTNVTFPAVTDTVDVLGTAQTITGIKTFSPAARSSGSAAYLTINAPTDTGQTASTESIGVSFVGATRTWATGALTTQREWVFAAPTIAFVGASTVTTAVTADFADPVQGTNATLTNKYSLRAATADIVTQLVVEQAATNGITLNNQTDTKTNYEWMQLFWTGNLAEIKVSKGGTGTVRSFAISAGNVLLTMRSGGSSVGGCYEFTAIAQSGANNVGYYFNGVTDTASSGTGTGIQLVETINQTSTANFTDFLINRTETAAANTQYFWDMQVAGATKAHLSDAGALFTNSLTTVAGATHAAGVWKLGALRTSTALTFSTTNVYEVDIGGTLVDFMICSTNP